VEQILQWYSGRGTRVLDVGCSGGLHAIEFSRRGFQVVGIDIEPSAVLRAEARARDRGLSAEFHVLDVSGRGLARLGRFHLIYSIGNVLSHVQKRRLPGVLAALRECLSESGVLVFDVLTITDPFPPEIREEDLGIVWKRKLHARSGKILLEGSFLRFGVEEHFEVWGYRTDEILAMLSRAGLRCAGVSRALDFGSPAEAMTRSACLYFRVFKEEAP
jgi:2-polyprenyl-3-methyl-5-hydroxy-6-metoxy-1,4-benzoquinol methylase